MGSRSLSPLGICARKACMRLLRLLGPLGPLGHWCLPASWATPCTPAQLQSRPSVPHPTATGPCGCDTRSAAAPPAAADFEQWGGFDFHTQKPQVDVFVGAQGVEFWVETQAGTPDMTVRLGNIKGVSWVAARRSMHSTAALPGQVGVEHCLL